MSSDLQPNHNSSDKPDLNIKSDPNPDINSNNRTLVTDLDPDTDLSEPPPNPNLPTNPNVHKKERDDGSSTAAVDNDGANKLAEQIQLLQKQLEETKKTAIEKEKEVHLVKKALKGVQERARVDCAERQYEVGQQAQLLQQAEKRAQEAEQRQQQVLAEQHQAEESAKKLAEYENRWLAAEQRASTLENEHRQMKSILQRSKSEQLLDTSPSQSPSQARAPTNQGNASATSIPQLQQATVAAAVPFVHLTRSSSLQAPKHQNQDQQEDQISEKVARPGEFPTVVEDEELRGQEGTRALPTYAFKSQQTKPPRIRAATLDANFWFPGPTRDRLDIGETDSFRMPISQVIGQVISLQTDFCRFGTLLKSSRRVQTRTGTPFVWGKICLAKGKWYYEVMLLTSGSMRFGWMSCDLQPSRAGLGSDSSGWAYDGNGETGRKVHHGGYAKEYVPNCCWVRGDILGCGVDLDQKTISYYLNGECLDTAYDEFDCGSGIRPGASLSPKQKVFFMFDKSRLRFLPNEYEALQICGSKITRLNPVPDPEMRKGLQWFPSVFDETQWATAVVNGDEKTMNELLDRGADIDNFSPEYEKYMTPLIYHTLKNRARTVQFLLDQAANSNHSFNQIAPIHVAAHKNNMGIMKILIKYDANLNLRSGSFEKFQWRSQTPLIIAAGSRSIDAVMLLIEHGVDIEASCPETALIKAASQGDVDVVGLLIKHKANVNRHIQPRSWRKDAGATSLMMAAKFPAVIDILLTNGANVDKETKTEQTALMYAAKAGNVQVVQSLLDYGATVHKVDQKGSTALLIAVEHGNTEVVKVLLEKYQDVSEIGHTALMKAARAGHADVARLLIKKGVDVNTPDQHGILPLFVAIQRRQRDVIKLLINQHADINATINPYQCKSRDHISSDWSICVDCKEGTELVCCALCRQVCHDGHACYHWQPMKRSTVLQRLDSVSSPETTSRQPYAQAPEFRKYLTWAPRKSSMGSYPSIMDDLDASVPDNQMLSCACGHGRFRDEGTTGVACLIYSRGISPLTLAAEVGEIDIVQTLLKHDAEASVQDMAGRTALMIALDNRNEELIALFCNSLRYINPQDSQIQMLFDIAVELQSQKQPRVMNALQQRLIKQKNQHIMSRDLLNVASLPTQLGHTFRADYLLFSASTGPVTIPVVCKIPSPQSASASCSGLKILQDLPTHPNVITYFAMCPDFEHRYQRFDNCIVVSCKTGASLRMFINRQKDRLSFNWIVHFAFDMSTALLHLHSYGYIHCDIAARSFIVCHRDAKRESNPYSCILFELEFVHSISEHREPQEALPWRWCSPETLEFTTVNKSTDVYMLGVALHELLGIEATPFAQFQTPKRLLKALKRHDSAPLPFPDVVPSSWRELITSCCRLDPNKRPTIEKVVQKLESLYDDTPHTHPPPLPSRPSQTQTQTQRPSRGGRGGARPKFPSPAVTEVSYASSRSSNCPNDGPTFGSRSPSVTSSSSTSSTHSRRARARMAAKSKEVSSLYVSPVDLQTDTLTPSDYEFDEEKIEADAEDDEGSPTKRKLSQNNTDITSKFDSLAQQLDEEREYRENLQQKWEDERQDLREQMERMQSTVSRYDSVESQEAEPAEPQNPDNNRRLTLGAVGVGFATALAFLFGSKKSGPSS